MNDAIDDSDDEVDYTKMDLGNKKGPIGRWDFDTQEEYSDYMSTKEALPKAAFQYGVKMQDGRKTRKHKTEKNEKAQLDREWQQIQVSVAFIVGLVLSSGINHYRFRIFSVILVSNRDRVHYFMVINSNNHIILLNGNKYL